MTTAYLAFADKETAIQVLTENNFSISEFQDHFIGNEGWGSIFQIPNLDGIFVNVYDYTGPGFGEYQIPAPSTPYNVPLT